MVEAITPREAIPKSRLRIFHPDNLQIYFWLHPLPPEEFRSLRTICMPFIPNFARSSEEQTKQPELVIGSCQTTTHRKAAPCDQQDTDRFLGVTPEENAGDRCCLLRIQMEVPADSRQGGRDVRATDKRYHVHDERDRYDANPSLRRRVPGPRPIRRTCVLAPSYCLSSSSLPFNGPASLPG